MKRNPQIIKQASATTSAVSDGYPIPDPMIFSNTRTRPEIFSESFFFFGYRIFEKVAFLLQKFTKTKLLLQNFTNLHVLGKIWQTRALRKIRQIFCANFFHPATLTYICPPKTCLMDYINEIRYYKWENIRNKGDTRRIPNQDFDTPMLLLMPTCYFYYLGCDSTVS